MVFGVRRACAGSVMPLWRPWHWSHGRYMWCEALCAKSQKSKSRGPKVNRTITVFFEQPLFRFWRFSNVSMGSDRVSCVYFTGRSLAAGRLQNVATLWWTVLWFVVLVIVNSHFLFSVNSLSFCQLWVAFIAVLIFWGTMPAQGLRCFGGGCGIGATAVTRMVRGTLRWELKVHK